MDLTQEVFSIRRMQVEDADDISNIFVHITKAPVRGDFKRLIEEHAAGGHSVALVAEMEGSVIGFMISYINTFGFGIERSAWIATMGVDPRYMGQGIGRKLAQETLSWFRTHGITNIYTSVRWDATDMLSFFKTLGFTRSDLINLTKELEEVPVD